MTERSPGSKGSLDDARGAIGRIPRRSVAAVAYLVIALLASIALVAPAGACLGQEVHGGLTCLTPMLGAAVGFLAGAVIALAFGIVVGRRRARALALVGALVLVTAWLVMLVVASAGQPRLAGAGDLTGILVPLVPYAIGAAIGYRRRPARLQV